MTMYISAKETDMVNYFNGASFHYCINYINYNIKAKTPITQRMNYSFKDQNTSTKWTNEMNEYVTEIVFAHDFINDLTGIELMTNLVSIKCCGTIGNLSPLQHCKKLENLTINGSGFIYCLEDLVNLPNLKTIVLFGILSNYNYAEFNEIVESFKSKPTIIHKYPRYNDIANIYTNKKLKKESLIGLASTRLLNNDLMIIVSKFL